QAQRDRGRAAAAPSAVAPVSGGRARGIRALRQPARPGQAHRPPDRSGEARSVAPRRDHRRGAGPRAARAARVGAERPGAPRRPRARRACHVGRLRRRAPLVKVAYYSPLPPSRSGIADYSALLLPALRERIDVVVARPGGRAPAADVALYHVGNDPDVHAWIADALRAHPGVAVLHEYVLHHL